MLSDAKIDIDAVPAAGDEEEGGIEDSGEEIEDIGEEIEDIGEEIEDIEDIEEEISSRFSRKTMPT